MAIKVTDSLIKLEEQRNSLPAKESERRKLIGDKIIQLQKFFDGQERNKYTGNS